MSGKWWFVRIGNRSGGGRVVKTLLGFCPCCRHRPQPAPTRPPWLGERLFRTSCAKTAAHHTKSKAVSKLHLNLHSDSLSTQATPPPPKTPVTQRGSKATYAAYFTPPHQQGSNATNAEPRISPHHKSEGAKATNADR